VSLYEEDTIYIYKIKENLIGNKILRFIISRRRLSIF
jgi:hypothetical protein